MSYKLLHDKTNLPTDLINIICEYIHDRSGWKEIFTSEIVDGIWNCELCGKVSIISYYPHLRDSIAYCKECYKYIHGKDGSKENYTMVIMELLILNGELLIDDNDDCSSYCYRSIQLKRKLSKVLQIMNTPLKTT